MIMSSHFMQTPAWTSLKTNFGWKKVDGTPFQVLAKSKFGIKILYVPRGPIIDYSNQELVTETFKQLKQLAKKEKAFFIRVSPALLENPENKKILNAQDFYYSKKQLQTKATMLIDLQRSEEELLASFHEKTRYNIRLAAKKSVTVQKLTSLDELQELYKILQKMADRQNYSLQSFEYYQYIFEKLSELATIYTAKHEGKIIGGIVIFRSAETIYYMYGGFDYEYRNLMGNYLVHWEVLKEAKANGYKYYDLQGIPLIKDENHPMYGFYRFKKGFNGQEVEYIGEYDWSPLKPLYWLWNNLSFEKNVYLE